MQLRHLTSSSVVVENGETTVLCDPWLLDGAFYGAWAHYPPLEFEPSAYDDVDYIYISDAYPDHFHQPTMERLDTETPVLIHDDATAFLKRSIEELGFEVTELPLAERVHLGRDLSLNIVGADGRGPAGSASHSESEPVGEPDGGQVVETAPQADTLAVFDDGEHVLVNANDCQWPLAERACSVVNDEYDGVDLLLVQYAATNFYPQCMLDYSHEEKLAARSEVIEQVYRNAEGFINALEPAYFMPFGGSYLLTGPLAELNEYLAAPTPSEAFWHFMGTNSIEPDHSDPVLLNSEAVFDIQREEASDGYTPIDRSKRSEYIETELTERSLAYEDDHTPTLSELTELLDRAYQHMDEHRREMGWASDTTVLLDLVDDAFAALSMRGDGYDVLTEGEADTDGGYVRFSMDPRLLIRILCGPDYARFDTAQVGSHIEIEKQPDVYERALYQTMTHLHV